MAEPALSITEIEAVAGLDVDRMLSIGDTEPLYLLAIDPTASDGYAVLQVIDTGWCYYDGDARTPAHLLVAEVLGGATAAALKDTQKLWWGGTMYEKSEPFAGSTGRPRVKMRMVWTFWVIGTGEEWAPPGA